MRNAMAGYDAWLERPYQEAAEAGDAFVAWCEANDVDPDANDAWDAYESAMQDAAEARAEDEAERRAEARAEAMRDGDWY